MYLTDYEHPQCTEIDLPIIGDLFDVHHGEVFEAVSCLQLDILVTIIQFMFSPSQS